MDVKRAFRCYRGPDDPGPFSDLINSMSFGCRHMKQFNPKGVFCLTAKVAEGYVKVLRVGDVDFIWTQAAGRYKIILTSSEDIAYLIPFDVSGPTISGVMESRKLTPEGTYYADNYEGLHEICPFIYTLDHLEFFIIITATEENWHKNIVLLETDGDNGGYYYSGGFNDTAKAWTIIGGVGYSISPYTYFGDGLNHLYRYLDQEKKIYTPAKSYSHELGVLKGELISLGDKAYGKKPFTLNENGIYTYDELVETDGVVEYPDDFSYNVFYPFCPYVLEISYFNILHNNNMAFFSNLYKHKISYKDKDGVPASQSLRDDAVSGTFPAQENSTVIEGSNAFGSEYYKQILTVNRPAASISLTKYSSIATVGDLKDVHIKTVITGTASSSELTTSGVIRSTNFPTIYYSPEFVDFLFFECCKQFSDSTNAFGTEVQSKSNQITGTQFLKVGDVVLDTGSINMSFSETETQDISHVGSAAYWKPCEAEGDPCPPVYPPYCDCGVLVPSINYTSLQMSVGETQELTASGTLPECECEWVLISGGGSVDKDTGVYTAPETNANCSNNPVIGLKCAGEICATIALAINAVVSDAKAYAVSDPPYCGGSFNWYHIIDNYQYRCDGTLVHSNWCWACKAQECGASSPDCVDVWEACETTGGFCSGLWSDTDYICATGVPVDLRTDLMKQQGCCPSGLL